MEFLRNFMSFCSSNDHTWKRFRTYGESGTTSQDNWKTNTRWFNHTIFGRRRYGKNTPIRCTRLEFYPSFDSPDYRRIVGIMVYRGRRNRKINDGCACRYGRICRFNMGCLCNDVNRNYSCTHSRDEFENV